MNQRTVIVNAAIVPMTSGASVLHGQAVAFEAETGEITYLGRLDELETSTSDNVIDAPGHTLIPGLVNAHGHGVHSLHKGTQEAKPLELWRQFVKARDRVLEAEDIYLGSLLSSAELLLSGCTTTLEHFYTGLDEPCMGAEHVLRAWQQIGIRGVLAPMLSDVSYKETLGLKHIQGPDGAEAEINRIGAYEKATRVTDAVAFIREHRDASSRVSYLLGPSAPHRCSDDMITSVAQACAELGIGWHMHVAETAAQRAVSLSRYGTSPVGRLQSLGVLSPNASIAHAVHCDDHDIKTLAEAGASVVHNPISNMKLGSGIARIARMRRQGVNVAIGTDGAASNDAQNMLESLKAAAMLQGLAGEPWTEWLPAEEFLRMATSGGAKALQFGTSIGRICKGAKADLVLLRPAPWQVPANDLVRQVVFGQLSGAVESVFVDGHQVVRNGLLTTIDQAALFDQVKDRMAHHGDRFDEESARVDELVHFVGAQLYQQEP